MKIKILIIVLLLSFCTLLSGCGGFFQEETIEIASITTIPQSDGSTTVIITYVDTERTPTTINIPKGETGKTGNGIQDISYITSKDGSKTIATFLFTDGTSKDVEIQNGKSIENIFVDDSTGDIVLTIQYSDRSTEKPITIPAGEKGADGIGILSYKYEKNEEDLSQTITIMMTDGREIPIEIPAPINGKDGEKGASIKEIISVPNGDKYEMTIVFDDDTEKVLEFARPNRWFSENGAPKPEDGIDGDLWYDLAHQKIYVKENGDWGKPIMDFGVAEPESIRIDFFLNDDDESPAGVSGSLYRDVPKGQYVAATRNKELPIPIRPGYKFLGWSTSAEWNPTNGYFTNFTYVYTKLELYAHWEKIE